MLGGRKRAHLDDPSQVSSPYLNCVGWQEKLTVEQLLCRWCLMLYFLAVTISTLHVYGQTLWSVLNIRDITLFIKLASYTYSSVIVAWSIELRKKMVIAGVRLISSPTRFLPTMTLYCTINCKYCRVQLKKYIPTKNTVGACRSQNHAQWGNNFPWDRVLTHADRSTYP